MDKIILDTSVLVKLFSPDEKDGVAEDLINQSFQKKLFLITLDIGIYELANTLKLSKKASVEVVSKNISDILTIKERVIAFSRELITSGLALMDKFDLTIYDSVFVAAAEIENIPLLTADYKHHKKEISKQIVYYKDWKFKRWHNKARHKYGKIKTKDLISLARKDRERN